MTENHKIGRPKALYGRTSVIRVPTFLVENIKEYVKKMKAQFKPKDAQP